MSAPEIIYPPTSGGGTPVGGTGTIGTLPIWVGASTLDNSAITQVAGSIFSLTGLVAGTGYANTQSVALGGGTGTGATASLNVSGGGVQWVGLLDPGSGYTAGDVLTIPGGVGGTITVLAVVPKNDASGHLTAQRIGAGTTQPNAGIDSRSGAFIGGWQRNFRVGSSLPTQLYVGGDVDASISGANFPVGLGVYTRNISTAAGAGTTYGAVVQPAAVTTSGAGTFFVVGGVLSSAYRSSAADLATNTGTTGPELWGVFSRCAHASGGAASYASAALIGFRQNTFFQVGGSADSVQNFVSNTSNISNATTIGTYYAFRERSFALSGGATIGTYYGLRLEPITGTAITNHWGVSQEDTRAKNQFLGNVGVGVDVGAGKVIASLTLTNGGTGYTNGTYPQVALTTVTGTGAGATADIVVAGGIVTTVVLRAPGQGYAVGDTLSCASIGAGSSFLVTVATTASIVRSDGTVVGSRVGAGTTTPTAPLDVVGLATIRKAGLNNYVSSTSGTAFPCWTYLNVDTSGESGGVLQLQAADPSGGTVFGTNSRLQIDSSLYSGTVLISGLTSVASLKNANAAGVKNVRGGQLLGNVSGTTTGVTVAVVYGLDAQASVNSSGGNTFTLMAGGFFTANVLSPVAETVTERTGVYISGGTFSGAAHVINNYYALRAVAPSLSGGSTITNRYAIAQEDTLARNYFRAPTLFGSAVGTARSATNPSVEVEAVAGVSNGDVRLRSASAVFDASNSSTNGVRYFARTSGTDLPATTTQSWYEEGTYTPAGNVNFTLGTCTGTWTRIGRKVFVVLNFAAGVNNGSTIAGASSLGLPNGLAPARSGLGLRAQVTGAASGNGLVAVNAATGLIEISTTVALDTNAKVIQCEYEV